MLKTLKGILKGNKIILEEPIPSLDEQNILLTLLDKPTTEEKQLILAGIQKGLQDIACSSERSPTSLQVRTQLFGEPTRSPSTTRRYC